MFASCRTKKMVEQQTMSINAIEALDLWDYDTIYPSLSVSGPAGDTATMIVRHRHLTGRKTNQHKDTIEHNKATTIALGTSQISEKGLLLKQVAILVFIVFCVLGFFTLLVRARN